MRAENHGISSSGVEFPPLECSPGCSGQRLAGRVPGGAWHRGEYLLDLSHQRRLCQSTNRIARASGLIATVMATESKSVLQPRKSRCAPPLMKTGDWVKPWGSRRSAGRRTADPRFLRSVSERYISTSVIYDIQIVQRIPIPVISSLLVSSSCPGRCGGSSACYSQEECQNRHMRLLFL